MSSNTLVNFMRTKGYDMVSPVKLSKINSYPFVTFINSTDPRSVESVWFSKAASNLIEVGESITSRLNSLYFYETENIEGEDRIKISFNERGDAEATLANRGFEKVNFGQYGGSSGVKLPAKVAEPATGMV